MRARFTRIHRAELAPIPGHVFSWSAPGPAVSGGPSGPGHERGDPWYPASGRYSPCYEMSREPLVSVRRCLPQPGSSCSVVLDPPGPGLVSTGAGGTSFYGDGGGVNATAYHAIPATASAVRMIAATGTARRRAACQRRARPSVAAIIARGLADRVDRELLARLNLGWRQQGDRARRGAVLRPDVLHQVTAGQVDPRAGVRADRVRGQRGQSAAGEVRQRARLQRTGGRAAGRIHADAELVELGREERRQVESRRRRSPARGNRRRS